MPATFTPARVTCAPGTVVTVPCSGFAPGPVTMSWSAQGGAGNSPFALPYVAPSVPPPYPPLSEATAPNNVATAVPAPAVVAVAASGTNPAGQALQFTVPDGLLSDVATVSDGTDSATLGIEVVAQYLQAAEYVGGGEGGELDPVFVTLGTGELDRVLRRAAALVDAFCGGTHRIRQWREQHRLGRGKMIYPYHRKPLVSLDFIAYVNSNQLQVVFQPTDFYLNESLEQIQVLANTFGTFVLAAVYQSIGYSANTVDILVTSGWPDLLLPGAIREAVAVTATDLLASRKKQQAGIGGLKQVQKDLLLNDGVPRALSPLAKSLLRPYVRRGVR